MKINILLAALIMPVALAAQNTVGTSPAPASAVTPAREPWTSSLIIRKGLDSKDDKDKPANFSLTWPQDGKSNSYLVNAAAGMDLTHVYKGKGSLELLPSFSFNRNNQVKKEQYNMKGAIAANLLLGRSDDVLGTHSFFSFFPTLQYMRNKIDTSSSFFATAYFTWVKKGAHGFALSNYANLGNSGFLLYASPSAGLEYQNRFDVKKPGTKGDVTRLFFGGDVRLAFRNGKGLPKRFTGPKLFELTFTYAGRDQLGNGLPVREGYTYLLKSELDYYPVTGLEDLCIGLSYNDGQDPIAAIEKQKFWQLAFKFKHDFTF